MSRYSLTVYADSQKEADDWAAQIHGLLGQWPSHEEADKGIGHSCGGVFELDLDSFAASDDLKGTVDMGTGPYYLHVDARCKKCGEVGTVTFQAIEWQGSE